MSEIAVVSLSTIIGTISGFLGLISTGLGIVKDLQPPASTDFYTIRMENGVDPSSAGNPLEVFLSDFTGFTVSSYFSGSSKASNDRCGVDKGSADFRFVNGIGIGEAPIMSIDTRNGFNLKFADVHAGGNAVCISNVILKGSDSQARADQVFIPLGDLLFQCGGFDWNWGTILNGVQQRCVWLDGSPSESDPNAIGILRLDMENLSGIFNQGQDATRGTTTLQTACNFISDLSKNGGTNQNFCASSKKRRALGTTGGNVTQINLLSVPSTEFADARSLAGYSGSSFMASDGKVYIPSTDTFVDVVEVQGTTSARDRRSQHVGRQSGQVVDVVVCTASTGEVSDCKTVKQVVLPTGIST